MKRLMMALICGFMLLAPLSAWGQKWIEPYVDKDGTQVEGHWQTSDDLRKDKYSTPGKVNPYTGQFTPYGGGVQEGPQHATPVPVPTGPPGTNPYYPRQDYKYRGN